MITLTEEEVKALRWWINWTEEEMEQKASYSVQMERSGEIQPGSVAREKELRETVLKLYHRL